MDPTPVSFEYMVTATHDPKTVLASMGLAETIASPGWRKALQVWLAMMFSSSPYDCRQRLLGQMFKMARFSEKIGLVGGDDVNKLGQLCELAFRLKT